MYLGVDIDGRIKQIKWDKVPVHVALYEMSSYFTTTKRKRPLCKNILETKATAWLNSIKLGGWIRMNPDFEFLNLDFNKEERKKLDNNLISYKKKISRIFSDARKQSKIDKCYHCGKPTTSFCNSHFVPAFCLRNIAVNGEVNYTNTLVNIPLFDIDKGVNGAGTFRLICRDCDSTIFSDYENPNNYINTPTPKMLAQIAMKNYLKFISKRLIENSMSDIVARIIPHAKDISDHQKVVQNLDLAEYQKGYDKAERLSKKNWDDEYYLFYYEMLDYVVPIAFQGGITLISDLEGRVINDIYNMSPDSHTKEVHICIFPLHDGSVIMMFIDKEDKCYRSFYKQFNKLPYDDKLALTNYIIFLYSEDVFFSKALPQELLRDEKLIELSKKTTIVFSQTPFSNPITQAAQAFKLTNWNSIPNLLDEKYKLR